MENEKDFKDLHKPIQVPARFEDCNTIEDKIIYALGQLEEASAKEVGFEVALLESSDEVLHFQEIAAKYLSHLYQLGLIKGIEHDDDIRYNLSKIERSNGGKVDPDLLDENLT